MVKFGRNEPKLAFAGPAAFADDARQESGTRNGGGMRRIVAGAVALAVSVSCALAQSDYPASAVKILVPFAAGGPTDVVARILADQLSARWNKSVVVENRPGAGT